MTDLEMSDLSLRLQRVLASNVPGVSITGVRRVQAGASSLTYLAEMHGGPQDTAVVKVAPPGLDPVRNRDMLRQARILRFLQGVPGVAVPGVLATDPGAPPGVPPLYVMTYVPGESFEPVSDEGTPPAPAEVEARARAAAGMLGRLHHVDPTESLSDEPVYSLGQEVARWSRAFSTVSDEDIHPRAADECGAQLLASLPDEQAKVVTHGDYRLGNMLCQSTAVQAIIDWEMWSINDPRIDLAWFLLMCDPDRPGLLIRPDTGMPPTLDLMSMYEDAVGKPAVEMDWFGALVRFKQAAASALIAKHNRQISSPNVRGLRFAELVEPLLAAAIERL